MNIKRDDKSKIMALGILGVLIVVVYWILISPLLGQFLDNYRTIDSLEHELSVYNRVSSGMKENESILNRLRAENPVADQYLSETKPTLAAATLQQLINRMVSKHGGQLVSTSIITHEQNEPLYGVSIQVHVRTEIDDLVELLYTIEHNRPIMFIDDLVIRSNIRTSVQQPRVVNRRRQLERRVNVPTLDVRFQLTAYTLTGGKQ
jgi:general secretion pathway protein M